jgi:hypothetical protein
VFHRKLFHAGDDTIPNAACAASAVQLHHQKVVDCNYNYLCSFSEGPFITMQILRPSQS